MLYQVGPLTIDTFPFSIESVDHEVTGDFAKHDLINARRGYEPVGPGDETLDLSGEILPFHIGGMSQIELAQALCDAQAPQFVMRGDGAVLGWFVVAKVRAKHGGRVPIGPNGVGYVVGHDLRLERVPDPGASAGSGLIASVLSLFG